MEQTAFLLLDDYQGLRFELPKRAFWFEDESPLERLKKLAAGWRKESEENGVESD